MAKNSKPRPRLPKRWPVHICANGVTVPSLVNVYSAKTDPEGPPAELNCQCGLVSHAEEWGNGTAPNEVGPRCPYCATQYELDEPHAKAPPTCMQCNAPMSLEQVTPTLQSWEPTCACFGVDPPPTLYPGTYVAEGFDPAQHQAGLMPVPGEDDESVFDSAPHPVDSKTIDEELTDALVSNLPERTDADGVVVVTSVSQGLTDEWLELSVRLELLEDEKQTLLAEYTKQKKKITQRVHEIRSELTAQRSGVTAEPAPPAEPPKQVPLFGGVDP